MEVSKTPLSQPIELKKCIKCEQLLPLTEFYTYKANGKPYNKCITCSKAHYSNYSKLQIEQMDTITIEFVKHNKYISRNRLIKLIQEKLYISITPCKAAHILISLCKKSLITPSSRNSYLSKICKTDPQNSS